MFPKSRMRSKLIQNSSETHSNSNQMGILAICAFSEWIYFEKSTADHKLISPHNSHRSHEAVGIGVIHRR